MPLNLLPLLPIAGQALGSVLSNNLALRRWKLQNAYNSPAAQLGRLRKAGVNPTMMGSSAIQGNTAGPVQQKDYGDIGTGASAQISTQNRALSMQKTVQQEQLEGMRLDNQAKRITNAQLQQQLGTENSLRQANITQLETAVQQGRQAMVLARQDMELKQRLGEHGISQDYFQRYMQQKQLQLSQSQDKRATYQVLNQVAAEWARIKQGDAQLSQRIYEFNVTNRFRELVYDFMERFGINTAEGVLRRIDEFGDYLDKNVPIQRYSIPGVPGFYLPTLKQRR